MMKKCIAVLLALTLIAGLLTIAPLTVDAAKTYTSGDNKISIRDVTAIHRHLAEFDVLTGAALLAADTNGDGAVTVDDVTHLQRYLAEYDVTLGVTA